MSISFQCSGCGKQLKAKDELAGKQAKCPACGQLVVVQAAPQPFQPNLPTSLPAKSPAISGREADPRSAPRKRRAHRPWHVAGGVAAVCTVVAAVFIFATLRKPLGTPTSRNEPPAKTAENTLGDEDFMAAFNKQVAALASETPHAKETATAALRALVKQSPRSLSLLEVAAHDRNMVVRIRASIGLEILSPDPDAPWRRILQDGKVFSRGNIDELLRAYSVVLAFGAITPHIDTSHNIGFKESKKATLAVKELVSRYGTPDEIQTDNDKVTWYHYGPIGLAVTDSGNEVTCEHLLMADAFWAMLYKAAEGKYPEQLKVVGLPDIQIKLPAK